MLTKNIFELSAPSYNEFKDSCRTHQDSYNKTLQQSSNFFLNPKYKPLYKTMTNDIVIFKSPASQTLVDIYHQSQQSWPQFIESTSLSHLQKNNMEIFSSFQRYQSQFTSVIHAPISELIKSKSILFKHDANDIVVTVSQIYNALKTRKIPENTCLQIDAQLNLELNDSFINSYDYDDDDSDDDDGDEMYEQMTKQFTRTIQQQKHNKTNLENEHKNNSDINENELAEITNVIRDLLVQLPTDPYSYKQYKMLLDLDEQTIKTSIKKNKIPNFEYNNSPLCRIFNSIKSMDVTDNTKLTFSFHAMADCVRIYCYVVVNDKVYGSRIFEKDLLNAAMIPSLFEDNTIETFNEKEVRKNMEGKIDEIYKRYQQVLFKRNASDLKTINEENIQSKIIISQKKTINVLERQMSSSTYNSNSDSTCTRSDTYSTQGIQSDWSIEIKDEIKQCVEKSNHQWKYEFNIMNCNSDTKSDTQSRGVPSDWSRNSLRNIDGVNAATLQQQTSDLSSETDSVICYDSDDSTKCDTQSGGLPSDWSNNSSRNIFMSNTATFSDILQRQTSDLTTENLKIHNEQLQISNDSNQINNEMVNEEVIENKQENNSDIFDDKSVEPIPNVYTNAENENNMIPNCLLRLNDSCEPLRMREYDKLGTHVQFADRTTVYYHNNILPEMMERLEDLSNRLQQLLQTPQDQMVAMNVFDNSCKLYFVVCIWIISSAAFNNYYRYCFKK